LRIETRMKNDEFSGIFGEQNGARNERCKYRGSCMCLISHGQLISRIWSIFPLIGDWISDLGVGVNACFTAHFSALCLFACNLRLHPFDEVDYKYLM